MRQLLFVALATLSVPAFATTPAETVAGFHEALKRGDMAQASALLAPAVDIYESGYVERSRAEYAAHHLPADMAFAKTTTMRILQQHEQASGDLAVVRRETETTGSHQGRPVHLFGTETVLLERDGDGWLITHVHWSSRKAK
ncbi:nuclear transport factor 2 family protein [Massilia agilis]|uniref:Nuclear transport factor 2 family protein n=1 Tax=Massilia agilis TaxID=1811226 RepID=A0ABT2D4T0_9BURK|nr:nuclear transport factor 2 family protein [Massilia agilis]MCS0806317.1 nuclear transport factor 2 family protein [Massilia agilis]